MTDEEIEIKTWHIGLICFILGLSIGGLSVYFYESRTDYRTPEEIATYLEEMLINKDHMEDLVHTQGAALLKSDITTLGEIRRWYEMLNDTGMPRSLLVTQINSICFKKQFKAKCK